MNILYPKQVRIHNENSKSECQKRRVAKYVYKTKHTFFNFNTKFLLMATMVLTNFTCTISFNSNNTEVLFYYPIYTYNNEVQEAKSRIQKVSYLE